MLHERALPGLVAREHAADLGVRLVALVHHDDGVPRQVVHQGRRRLPRGPPREVTRVVLDAVAMPRLGEHVQIEERPLHEPLRFEQLPLLKQPGMVLVELFPDRDQRPREVLFAGHVVGPREERHAVLAGQFAPGQRVEAGQSFDLIAVEPHPEPQILVPGHDLHGVAPYAETAAFERGVIALILHLHKLPEERLAGGELGALLEHHEHSVVGLGRAQAVDAGDARDDQDVAALEERPGRGEAEAVDLLVDGGFLLDVGVARRNVGLGLVVVVVADEVLDGVVREEPAELLIELGRQRLVVRDDQRRPVDRFDHPRDGIRLPRTRDPEQYLVRVAPSQPLGELVDGLLLVAARLERAHHPERTGGLRRGESGTRVGSRPFRRAGEPRRTCRHPPFNPGGR